MKFDLSDIQLSHQDIKNKIIFPKSSSRDLSEFLGILSGDGHVYYNLGSNDYIFSIFSNLKDERNYSNYIKDKVLFLFNVKMNLYQKKKINTLILTKRSKGILSFLNIIGYKKINYRNKVPRWIWDNKIYAKAFIKGIFDTDGSLCLKKNHGKYKFYPVINLGLKDKNLIYKISDWIKIQKIDHYVGHENYIDKRTNKRYEKYKIQISGYNNASSFIKLIRSSNIKNIKKMERGGFEPPIWQGILDV